MIKLIVCDLDGTLLDKPNAISQENLDAIDYAYQRGARFGFATGREWMSIQNIKAQLHQEPLLILSNGAIVCEGDGTIVHKTISRTNIWRESLMSWSEMACHT